MRKRLAGRIEDRDVRHPRIDGAERASIPTADQDLAGVGNNDRGRAEDIGMGVVL